MATPLHVLILEGRPADAALMVHELRRARFDPVWRRVETEPDYLAHLQAGLDVILADYALPQFDALRALQLLQERGGDTPSLIVSGTMGEELAVSAMRQDAADYLLKDRLARLGPAVVRALQEVAERRARQQAELERRGAERTAALHQAMAERQRLEQQDTGGGIPAQQRARIFEPLYTTKPGGTGLGLYIMQQIVAAHGGR